MNISDVLYFAPGLRFDEVDFDGPRLVGQFSSRIEAFYLEPAEDCANRQQPFAAGVLLVSAIDALARLRSPIRVGARFRNFVMSELRSFSSELLAQRFYDDFRNGLVHEGRVKRGSQFSLGIPETVAEFDAILVVNPKYLAQEVRVALGSYVTILEHDANERKKFAEVVNKDFADDRG